MNQVDYLNGVAVQIGQKHGVPTPINAALLKLVHEGTRLSATELLAHLGPEANVPPVSGWWVAPGALALGAGLVGLVGAGPIVGAPLALVGGGVGYGLGAE